MKRALAKKVPGAAEVTAVEAAPAIDQSDSTVKSSGILSSRVSPAFALKANQLANMDTDTRQQKFETTLSQEAFKGLKAILDSLSSDREALRQGVSVANSYEELLSKLGYRITLTKQIHVQDCYSRVGPTGGIRVVLPYYHIPAQSSLPTLVNFDSTVTTTAKSAGFFNELLREFKTQLHAQP